MKRLKNILVHVDTRNKQHVVLTRAAELAKSQGAKLSIVDIVPELSWPVRLTAPDYEDIKRAVVEQKETAIQALAAELRKAEIDITAKVLSGRTSDQIIAEVVRFKHDLVMRDAKGQFSQQPGAFGATALRLIRYCPCPVWAYRPTRSAGAGQVVVAVDAGATDEEHQNLNREILDWAIAVAGESRPHIVYAWSVYGESLIKDYMKRDDYEALERDAEKESREQLQKLLGPFKFSVEDSHVHLLRGEPALELTKFVNTGGYDVLVLGTVARTGITGLLLGNTAEALLNRVECSVVAIKPANFQTPIKVA